MDKKKIAIVGAGIFGCTLGLVLHKNYHVQIFEKKKDILNDASKMNQQRFHLGFHYPRSFKTIDEIQRTFKDFIKFYGNNIYGKTKNYYAISKNNSKISYDKYKSILIKKKLTFKEVNMKELSNPHISKLILTNEKNLNYFDLKKKIKKLFNKSNIKLNLSNEPNKKTLDKFDKVFITTYKDNNEFIKNLGFKNFNRKRYELVEKTIIELPKKYRNLSLVILDGNFLCIDPYLGTKYHLLSHVKLSKIKIINNIICKFPKKYNFYINNSYSKDLKYSNFYKIIKHSSKYIPFLKTAKYRGSFYLVRALNINSKKNDDRTNSVNILDSKYSTILSGKWNTAVTLSKNILLELNKKNKIV